MLHAGGRGEGGCISLSSAHGVLLQRWLLLLLLLTIEEPDPRQEVRMRAVRTNTALWGITDV